MTELNLTVTVEEANALLALMGDTPSKYGYFPLMQKLKAQAEAQLPKKEESQEG